MAKTGLFADFLFFTFMSAIFLGICLTLSKAASIILSLYPSMEAEAGEMMGK